jgi:signal transduction histidine kinase
MTMTVGSPRTGRPGARPALAVLGASAPGPVLVAIGALVLVAAAIVVHPLSNPGAGVGDRLVLAGLGAAVALCAALGALIVAGRPGHGFGRAMLVGGGIGALWIIGMAWADGVPAGSHRPLLDWAGWLENWAFIGMLILVTWPLLLFPDGRLPSRRWRPVAVLLAIGIVAIGLHGLLDPGALQDSPGRSNPLPVPGGWAGAIDVLDLAGFGVPLAVVTGMIAVHRRARASGGPGMTTALWASRVLAANFVLFVVLAIAGFGDGPVYAVSLTLSFAVFAGSAAIAVLRQRAVDVDPHLRRSFLVLGNVAAVLVIFLAVYSAGSALAGAGAGGVVGGLCVLTVALPLRTQVRGAIDRLLFGHRDGASASARLAGELARADGVAAGLRGFGRVVGEALGASGVIIEPRPGVGVEADRWGSAPVEPALTRDLTHGGEPLGRMVVGARVPGEPYAPADVALVELLAHQVAPMVDALRLAEALRRSRDEVVRAREEERRRLRHDLHDGLGPTMAGIAMMLDAARHAPEGTGGELLDQARVQTGAAIEDLRRIARGLRPSVLDQLGLRGAIRAHADRLGPLAVEISMGGDEDPPLPAAAELAVYRVAAEALTNVVRHSGATRCRVTLRAGTDVIVTTIDDDGCGLAEDAEPGVGLHSMAHRAAELGGRIDLGRGPLGGLRVAMLLPRVVSETPGAV